MAPHSSTLAWKIPWAAEPGRLQSMGSLRVGHDWATSLSLSLSCIGEGNGNPPQCSCLENPRDRAAWWASIYGIAQSRTLLKWLSSSSSSSMVKGEFDSRALLLESVMLLSFFIFVLKHEVVQWCWELKQSPITLLAFWYWASDISSLGMGVQNIKISKGKRWKPSKLSGSKHWWRNY